jgi:adenylate kinase family enzyme
MKKVLIIGCGGSGKSTLARKLGELTELPVYHLDALYWNPGWVPTPRDEWDAMQRDLIQGETWIMDGNYGKTLDIRVEEADTIIFLDMPRWTTLYRVFKRRIQYHKRTRPDMSDGCPEKLDLEFIKWIWDFRKDKRPAIIQKLRSLSDKKNIIILRTPKDVSEFIGRVRENM